MTTAATHYEAAVVFEELLSLGWLLPVGAIREKVLVLRVIEHLKSACVAVTSQLSLLLLFSFGELREFSSSCALLGSR